MAPGNIVYGSAPPAVAAPAVPVAPPGAATFGPAPMATLNGSIQPAPGWDPYAPPGTAAPASLLPQDPYLPAGQIGLPSASTAIARMQRFMQEMRLDYHWFSGGHKPEDLGINDIETSVTFALPFFGTQSPLLITPGFAFHFWQGPGSDLTLPYPVEMPPRTYDAWLEGAWNPQVTPWFGAELSVRTGYYSDYKRWDSRGIRITGKGMAVLTFSPSFKLKGGIWYLDRVFIKILPAGGIVWSPNPDVRFDILFPNPKITARLGTFGATEWWWYVSGDYGGDSWTIERTQVPDSAPDNVKHDQVDYNDMRVALGLEFKRMAGLGLNGIFEVGYAFQRELRYRSMEPKRFDLHDTVFLRAGLSY